MSKEIAFTVFCLENYKTHRNLSGQEVSCFWTCKCQAKMYKKGK